MLSFFVGVVLGAVQFALLVYLLKVLHKKPKKIIFGLFMLKFLIYGTVIALLMFKFNSYAENLIYGFIAAVPLCAVLGYIYTVFSKQLKKITVFVLEKTKKLVFKK